MDPGPKILLSSSLAITRIFEIVFFLFPELTLCSERKGGQVCLQDRVVASPWDGELGLCAGSFPGGRCGECHLGWPGAHGAGQLSAAQGSKLFPNPADFSLLSYFFFSPRSDKTLQDIVYKLVPGLFKGTAMDNYNCVGLGLFVTRSHPPVKPVPRISLCPRTPLPV